MFCSVGSRSHFGATAPEDHILKWNSPNSYAFINDAISGKT